MLDSAFKLEVVLLVLLAVCDHLLEVGLGNGEADRTDLGIGIQVYLPVRHHAAVPVHIVDHNFGLVLGNEFLHLPLETQLGVVFDVVVYSDPALVQNVKFLLPWSLQE